MHAATASPVFEDVKIGDELPRLYKGPVTHTDLVKYSGASGDFNPIHTVPEYARSKARLPGLIAHGMLSMAWAGQLVTDWMGPDAEVKRLKAQFRAMTFLGDKVTCEGIVSDKRQTKDGNLVDINITLRAGKDERQTLLGSATVALPTRGKRAAKAPAKKKAAKAPGKKARPKKKAAKKPAKKRAAAKGAAKKKAAGKRKTAKRPAKKASKAKRGRGRR